jgi:uncharacterized protein (DUF1697 family)
MSATHVALLRGLNVGGKNILPMSDLRALFTAAGCRDVRTYIQSGNVIFTADADAIASLPEAVAARITERFGFRTPVILRTGAELADVIRHNPFIAQGAATEELHVSFLAERPNATQIDSLDPNRSPPDTFVVRGQEIYLRFPRGLGRTKLTSEYFDRRLATTGTVRNWRTVTKLLALMDA